MLATVLACEVLASVEVRVDVVVGMVGHGVCGCGGGWDDGVNGQRKTRVEDMVVCVSEEHGAHLGYESPRNC